MPRGGQKRKRVQRRKGGGNGRQVNRNHQRNGLTPIIPRGINGLGERDELLDDTEDLTNVLPASTALEPNFILRNWGKILASLMLIILVLIF